MTQADGLFGIPASSEALRHADAKGRLQVVAATTGIAGGIGELRKIMKSSGELSIMDRGMLGLALFGTS